MTNQAFVIIGIRQQGREVYVHTYNDGETKIESRILFRTEGEAKGFAEYLHIPTHDSAKCDPEVFNKGEFISMLCCSKENAEQYVKDLSLMSGQRVDWSYCAGRVIVKALGDIAAVNAAVERLKVPPVK